MEKNLYALNIVAVLFLSIVFFAVPNFSSASTIDILSAYPWEGDTVSTSAGGTPQTIVQDANGYYLWEWSSGSNSSVFFNSASFLSVPATGGYKVWLLGTRSSDNRVRTMGSGSAQLSDSGVPNTAFTVDGYSIRATSWSRGSDWGANDYMFIDALRPGAGIGGTYRIYAIIYTDEDLSYIDTETELYEYIDILNPPNTTTRITSQNLPSNGSTTGSTSVAFDFDYYFNSSVDDYDKSGVDVQNISIAQLVLTNEEDVPALSGNGTYNDTIVLYDGAQYLWRPYLRNSTTGQKVVGTWQSFFVVSNPYPLNSNIISTSTATSTLGTLDIFSNLQEIITTRPPFGFIFELKNSFDNLATSTPPVSLVVESNLDTAIFQPLRIGLAWIMWIFFGVYLVKRIRETDFL